MNLNEMSSGDVRVGAGDSNDVDKTSAPVEDGVGVMGVYVSSFRARHSARHSQQRECVVSKQDSLVQA
jgi:L-amino acid N-acyltransferase YncA